MKKLHHKKGMPLPFAKIDLKMKLTAIFVFATFFSMLASNKGYTQTITLEEENTAIIEVINKIEVSTKYRFVYNTKFVDLQRKVSINLKDASIEKVLTHLFDDTNTAYQISRETQIILKHKKVEKSSHNTANNKQSTTLQNQQVIINGTVIDETGQPLPGANIQVKGTNLGTTTDFDGNFSLEIPSSESIIVVSYIGYTTQEVSYDGQKSLSISLAPSAASLDEVVVIGYGSVAKKDLTGSVGVVDNVADRPVVNVVDGLQGSVSGVTVTSNGGDPTKSSNIQIRGLGTINSESPLWIVDGVPYYGGPINPFDIASMSILKDASSQAIYGVRASGGVILVTTKKGKSGKLSFDFNSYVSILNAKKPEALNAADRVKYMSTANLAGFDPANEDTTTRTNWIDEIFRTGVIKNYDVGVRGGTEKFTFASSLGLNQTEGTLLNTKADRFTFKLSSTYKVNDKLKIGESVYYTRTSGNSAFTGTTDPDGAQSYNGIIAQAIKALPSVPVRNASGEYSDVTVATIHPVASLERLDIEDVNQDLFANIYLDYDVLDDLKLKTSFGINYKTRDFQEFKPKNPETSKTRSERNTLDYLTANQVDWSWETTLNYNTTLNDVHNLTLLGGHTMQRFERNTFSITGRDFSSELSNLRKLVNANSWTKPLTSYQSNSLMSVFARAIYNYDDKYILTASVRRDGTSKIPEAVSDNTWGTFPSVAVAWNVSNERFLEDNKTIDKLKLRTSWGIIGNINSLDNYPTDIRLLTVNTILGSDDENYEAGLALDGRSNTDITWELTKSLNFGIDASFLKNWSFSGDYFVKTTEDMILRLQGSSLEGISKFPNVNAGTVENKGFEISLAYQQNIGDFNYKISGNLSKIDNEVTYIENNQNIEHVSYNVASHTPLVSAVGQPLFSYYVLETDGIFQSDAEAAAHGSQPDAMAGDLKFIDHNGDGKINDDDRVFRGSAFPDFTYAFNIDMDYKNFDLRLFLQGTSGSSAYNGFKLTTMYPHQTSIGGEANLSADAADTWSPTNRNSSNFRLAGAGDNLRASDFWIEDTSYLRLKNLTLGYTFSKIKKINSLRVYLAGENLFTITDYSGLDPELSIENRGLDGGQYPISTTYSLGLNLSF